MIILLIGSGAREHAIAMALNRASQEKSIHCLASNMNPGIAQLCTEIKIGDYNDSGFVRKYANDIKADLAIKVRRIRWQRVYQMTFGNMG